MRLVLGSNSTIRVDGETHSIRVPSGEASGLKLKGPFEIPRGRLFTLYIQLDTDRSVSWNQGTGFRLHPVLNISSGPEVLGIFRGNLVVSDFIGVGETLVELRADGSARMRVSTFPRYTVLGNFNYNSFTRILRLNNFSLEAPNLSRRRRTRVMREFPNEVLLPVRQWSLDNIIAIDTAGVRVNLYRVGAFNFSEAAAFTEFTLNIDYPNSSSSGKYVAAVIEFIDTGATIKTITGTLQGSRFTEIVPISNNFLLSNNTRLRITAYLFNDPDDLNTEFGVFANNFAEIMSGSRFSASTNNPWQPPAIFTLQRNVTHEQEFTVSFTGRMNVRMAHDSFTNNNPVVSWTPLAGANNGYLVFVAVQNRNFEPALGNIPGNRPYIPAFYQHTFNTSVTIDSELIRFTQQGSSPPTIDIGDMIVVEVYALDNSGLLDTANRRGALSMEALRVVRR